MKQKFWITKPLFTLNKAKIIKLIFSFSMRMDMVVVDMIGITLYLI